MYANTLQHPFPSLEKWQKRLDGVREHGVSLVAEIDGVVVGHLGLHPEQNPRRRHAAGLGMMVDATHHGRGVGSRLLGAAIDLAENWLNVTRLELTVFTDNRAAVALYEHGFRVEVNRRAMHCAMACMRPCITWRGSNRGSEGPADTYLTARAAAMPRVIFI